MVDELINHLHKPRNPRRIIKVKIPILLVIIEKIIGKRGQSIEFTSINSVFIIAGVLMESYDYNESYRRLDRYFKGLSVVNEDTRIKLYESLLNETIKILITYGLQSGFYVHRITNQTATIYVL